MEKMMENKTWTLNVEENEDGDQYITLPEEVLQQLNLKEGDTVEWIDNKDGSWTLVKKEV
jgi:bifunctional DNA-binding transcriptional regulator/antitoxin component of YhaV-PrlF toxin-antitoxin module